MIYEAMENQNKKKKIEMKCSWKHPLPCFQSYALLYSKWVWINKSGNRENRGYGSKLIDTLARDTSAFSWSSSTGTVFLADSWLFGSSYCTKQTPSINQRANNSSYNNGYSYNARKDTWHIIHKHPQLSIKYQLKEQRKINMKANTKRTWLTKPLIFLSNFSLSSITNYFDAGTVSSC